MISICFIGDRNVYLKRICNYLAGQGYTVNLICRNSNGISVAEFEHNITIYTLSSPRVFIKVKEINRLLHKIKPDFVHFQYLTKDVILALFIHRKYKVIFTPWGSDLNIFSMNILNRIIINIGLLACFRIQIITEGIRKKLMKTFLFISSKKMIDLSWGIDYASFHRPDNKKIQFWRDKLGISEDNFVLLSYRNHKPLYNHHTIIRSLPLIIKNNPNVRCIFTRGSFDEAYLNQNKTLVAELHLKKQVIFVEEWIPDEMLPSLVNLADIAVSIPLNDGLPATLLEIMATKAIPVTGNLEIYACFFEHMKNGLILNQIDDHEELASIILDSIKNLNAYRKKFSKNNNSYVKEKQNWNTQKTKMEQLYFNM